jgi:hypothetical protein
MAAKKRSTRKTKAVGPTVAALEQINLDYDAPVKLPSDPEAMRRLAEIGVRAGRLLRQRVEAGDASERAREEAQLERQKRENFQPTQDTVKLVASRLESVAMALLAMKKLCPQVQVVEASGSDVWSLTLFEQTCRSAFLTTDACIMALTGDTLGIGNFRDPLDRDERDECDECDECEIDEREAA